MEIKKAEQEVCPYCGECPVCGKQNSHHYHKHKPWTLYPCHPFHDGVVDSTEEVKEEKSGDKDR